MHRYTNCEKEFILANYKGTSTSELAARFNARFHTHVTPTMMKAYKGNHKLGSGLTACFQKGHVPANKGTKGVFNVGGNKTSFKPGNLSANTLPIGTEKVLKDGYIWVKVDDQPKVKKNVNWVQKQRLVWEKVHGPVPAGYYVLFANGNKRNFDVGNLVLVTRSEMLYLNRHHMIYNNADFTKSAVLIARIDTMGRSKTTKGENK